MQTTVGNILLIATLVLAGLLMPARPLPANGDEKHDHSAKKSTHMQAMYALKDQIPQEYRIMERTPIVPDRQSLARGEELYARQCALCHGRAGHGDGPAAKGLATPPANFLDLEHSGIYGPGEKYWIIGNGSGETGMPAFPQIDLIDRWNLVNYIYDLQESKESESGHDHGHSSD